MLQSKNNGSISKVNKGTNHPNPLDREKKAILSDLLRIKAATPLQFEVRSGRIGDNNLTESLNDLVKLGYVDVDNDNKDNYEDSVFYPTWKARWLRIIGEL
jgi:hypothetical protein